MMIRSMKNSRWINSCAIKYKVQPQSICIKNAKHKTNKWSRRRLEQWAQCTNISYRKSRVTKRNYQVEWALAAPPTIRIVNVRCMQIAFRSSFWQMKWVANRKAENLWSKLYCLRYGLMNEYFYDVHSGVCGHTLPSTNFKFEIFDRTNFNYL